MTSYQRLVLMLLLAIFRKTLQIREVATYDHDESLIVLANEAITKDPVL